MDDAPLVQVADRLCRLLDGPAELFEPLWLPRRQRLPPGVAREQAQPALIVGEGHEVDDARVVEVPQQRGFVPQRLAGVPLLDRHQVLPVQLGAKCHAAESIKNMEISGKMSY